MARFVFGKLVPFKALFASILQRNLRRCHACRFIYTWHVRLNHSRFTGDNRQRCHYNRNQNGHTDLNPVNHSPHPIRRIFFVIISDLQARLFQGSGNFPRAKPCEDILIENTRFFERFHKSHSMLFYSLPKFLPNLIKGRTPNRFYLNLCFLFSILVSYCNN